MKPVMQTKLYSKYGIGNGNCFAACLASMLELPLWMIPPFEEMFGRSTEHFMTRVDQWLDRMHGLKLVRTEGHKVEDLPEYYIASGLSARKVYHSVIFSKGSLVHDPHYSNSGIENTSWTWHLEKRSTPVVEDDSDHVVN